MYGINIISCFTELKLASKELTNENLTLLIFNFLYAELWQVEEDINEQLKPTVSSSVCAPLVTQFKL